LLALAGLAAGMELNSRLAPDRLRIGSLEYSNWAILAAPDGGRFA